MNKISKLIVVSLIIIYLFSVSLDAQNIESEEKIKIATFNIHIFGKTKRAKFEEEYDFDKGFSKKVSDHYPVWAEFFIGKDDD